MRCGAARLQLAFREAVHQGAFQCGKNVVSIVTSSSHTLCREPYTFFKTLFSFSFSRADLYSETVILFLDGSAAAVELECPQRIACSQVRKEEIAPCLPASLSPSLSATCAVATTIKGRNHS